MKLLRSLNDRKQRRAHGLCLVEGIRLVEEALSSGLIVGPLLFSPERLSSGSAGRALRKRLEHHPAAEEIDDAVLAHLSDTVTSQGVIAAAQIPLPARLPEEGIVLILDGIADPGNAGTMIRTAWAAGVSGVLALKSTTDLWAPKAVRAGMGGHFYVRIFPDLAWGEVTSLAGERPLLLAASDGAKRYWEVDWHQPAALIIASEAHGASPEARENAATTINIPMAENAESLNAAMAAAIILFEARKQGLEAGLR